MLERLIHIPLMREGGRRLIAWKDRELESIKAWKSFFSRINGYPISDFSSLSNTSRFGSSVETATLEKYDEIGSTEDWRVFKPTEVSNVPLLIAKSFPKAAEEIQALSNTLVLDFNLIMEAIDQAKILTANTGFDRKPELSEDSGSRSAFIELPNGKIIGLRRFSSPLLHGKFFISTQLEYYSPVRIMRLNGKVKKCQSLIMAQAFSQDVDFRALYPWVLLFATHAVLGEEYYTAYQAEKAASLQSS